MYAEFWVLFWGEVDDSEDVFSFSLYEEVDGGAEFGNFHRYRECSVSFCFAGLKECFEVCVVAEGWVRPGWTPPLLRVLCSIHAVSLGI